MEAGIVPPQESHRGEGGVAEEGIVAVIDHILKDHHTKAVTEMIEHGGLYLDMLPQGIEAQRLHGLDIPLIVRGGGGGKNPIAKVALIEKTVEEIGLAV
jgi:hypothetical protein